MTHDRFRFFVVLAAYLISLAVLVVNPWPGFLPSKHGDWPVGLIASFGFPTAALAIVLLFRRVRRTRSFLTDIERYREVYDLILDAVVVLIAGLHLDLLAYLLAARIWFGSVFVVFLGGVIVFVGNLLPKLRPNGAIGIRTPWTLRDEGVWRKTHRLGGYVVFLAGLTLMATAVIRFQASWAVLTAWVAAAGFGLPLASYLLWRRSAPARTNDSESTPPPLSSSERGPGPEG